MKTLILIIVFCNFIPRVYAQDIALEVVTEHWPPFIIKGEELGGTVTINVKEILNITGLSYTLNLYPWARSYKIAMSKPNVLIYSISRTKEREAHFHWFCPIYKSTPAYAFKLKSNDINIRSLASLKKARIGIMRGDSSHEYFLSKGFIIGQNLYLATTEEMNVVKLLNREIDVVIQTKEALDYRLDELGAKDKEVIAGYKPHKGDPPGQCMALSKGTDPKIIQQVSHAFKNWVNKEKDSLN